MTPHTGSNTVPTSSQTSTSSRFAAPVDLPRKAAARLAERIDLTRNKHKPLSILRAEAKRVLEQFLDQDGTAATLSRTDRDRIIEDLIASSVGFGPLEDVFRDEFVKEILILSATQIVGWRNDNWLPISAKFRDDEQLRVVLSHWLNVGEHYLAGSPTIGGYDLRLPNGFRVIALLPPSVMQITPQALLVRAAPLVTPTTTAGIGSSSSVGSVSGIYRPQSGASGPRQSGVQAIPSARSNAGQAADKPESGVITLGAPLTRSAGPASTVNPFATQTSFGGSASSTQLSSTAMLDPYARMKQKVTARIITKLASAGVYDLNVIALNELRKVIVAQIMEYCVQEKLHGDEGLYDRLSLEILSGMNR